MSRNLFMCEMVESRFSKVTDGPRIPGQVRYAESIYRGAGADTLFGNAGDNRLDGGAGDDTGGKIACSA